MTAQVIEKELVAIRRACQKLDHDYNPPITFLVVQKRHHTRIFAENQRDQVEELETFLLEHWSIATFVIPLSRTSSSYLTSEYKYV